MQVFYGKAASAGIAAGRIYEKDSKNLHIVNAVAGLPEEEISRYDEAREQAKEQLRKLYEHTLQQLGQENAAVFEVHEMLLQDPQFVEATKKIISEQHVNAAYAVSCAAKQLAPVIGADDVRDVAERIINILQGNVAENERPAPDSERSAPDSTYILLADDLLPSETVRLNKTKVLAFVTRKGSLQSHTAIFAKTMGIPAVVGADVSYGLQGRSAIIDGFTGQIFVESSACDDAWDKLLREYQAKQVALKEQTKDRKTASRFEGKLPVKVYANINGLDDLDAALCEHADGIGLFRSEGLYLSAMSYPTEEEQFLVYKATVQKMAGKPVIIRTMDIGADKKADYFDLKPEDNPALGMRGIRLSLAREEVFRTQLRAICRAGAYGDIAVMFPMITSAWEVERAKKILLQEQQSLKNEQITAGNVKMGIMIETPAAVMESAELATMVDFFSIGTNDLTQYTLAADRQNAELASVYDAHHPAILKMIQMTVTNAHKAGIPVGICGELAGEPSLLTTFLEMGIDELSVAPGLVLELKNQIVSKV